MGLKCADTDPSKLQPIIDDVVKQLPTTGTASSFLIDRTTEVGAGPASTFLRSRKLAAGKAVQKVAESEWSPDEVGLGYADSFTLVNANFNKLANFYPNFNGVQSPVWERSGKFSTASSIEQLFLAVATNLSAQVITGINQPTLLAVLSNVIPASTKPDAVNYDESDNRLVFLVLDYNPERQDCAGIGFVYIQYHLQIENYKKKNDKPLKHETTLTINIQSAIYSDVSVLNAQVQWLHHNDARASRQILAIPPKYKFKIFDSLPPAATAEVFGSALPLESTTQKLTSLVFYAANLACLGNLDNKASQTESSYSIATTSGFTFEMGQSIGVSTTVEAGVIFAKASVTVSMSLEFSEQWNTETTETIQFTVPGGAQAFVYKGTLRTKYVYFDPSNSTYSYGTAGSFNTNYLMTSSIALTGDPVYQT